MSSIDARAAEGRVFAHWPNRITAIRFVGAMVLFAILGYVEEVELAEGRQSVLFGVATALFVAVAATDWLDGWLARRYGHVTAFGRIADPFVDKILVLGSFVLLAVLEPTARFVPGWLVVLVLARELLVTGIRGYVESIGLSFAADRWGKLKMIVQCIAIALILGYHGIPWPEAWLQPVATFAYVAVGLTLLSSVQSGLAYAFKCRSLLSGAGSAASDAGGGA